MTEETDKLLHLVKRAIAKHAQTNKSTDAEVQAEESKGVEQAGDKAPAMQVKLDVDERQTKFLSDEMAKMLNEQIAFEMFSAYLYFMAAAWAQSKGLTGFEAHFKTQGDGEIGHAMKIYGYLIDTGSKLDLPAIPSPTDLVKFTNMQECCRSILDHEMVVTKRWKAIGDKAKTEDSLATWGICNWFIQEQIEEEDLSLTLLQRTMLADSGAGLLIIDADLKG